MSKPAPGTIRPLTPRDLEAVIAIDTANTGASRRGYFEKRLGTATRRPKEHVYVGVLADGQLAGFALAKLERGEFGKPGASASLDAIGVSPEHGHKGFGQQLLQSVGDILADKGVATLACQVDWPGGAMLGFFASAGFELAPRLVLTRSTAPIAPQLAEGREDDWDDEPDYSSPDGDDVDALSHDQVPIRTMNESDLRKIIAIDRANTGTDRGDYLARKQHESLKETGVHVSLVAELEDYPVGFIMARVDFGEFGHASAEAEMDTIGVDPGYQGRGVGRALMSQLVASLAMLQVETVRTEIDWNDVGLIAYLEASGFAPAQRVSLVRRLG
ncbi:MAG: GNAT family N-acetyltransferase [Rhodobacteraceae bacterium]|nr:GNAT family N-acetyltransferase [Paracoccaceae bacterium]